MLVAAQRCQAAPSLLEEFALDGRCLSESENLLAREAPQKAAMLEQLRQGSRSSAALLRNVLSQMSQTCCFFIAVFTDHETADSTRPCGDFEVF